MQKVLESIDLLPRVLRHRSRRERWNGLARTSKTWYLAVMKDPDTWQCIALVPRRLPMHMGGGPDDAQARALTPATCAQHNLLPLDLAQLEGARVRGNLEHTEVLVVTADKREPFADLASVVAALLALSLSRLRSLYLPLLTLFRGPGRWLIDATLSERLAQWLGDLPPGLEYLDLNCPIACMAAKPFTHVLHVGRFERLRATSLLSSLSSLCDTSTLPRSWSASLETVVLDCGFGPTMERTTADLVVGLFGHLRALRRFAWTASRLTGSGLARVFSAAPSTLQVVYLELDFMAALTLSEWIDCFDPVKDQLRELVVLCDRCEFHKTVGPEKVAAGLVEALGRAKVFFCRREEHPTGLNLMHTELLPGIERPSSKGAKGSGVQGYDVEDVAHRLGRDLVGV